MRCKTIYFLYFGLKLYFFTYKIATCNVKCTWGKWISYIMCLNVRNYCEFIWCGCEGELGNLEVGLFMCQKGLYRAKGWVSGKVLNWRKCLMSSGKSLEYLSLLVYVRLGLQNVLFFGPLEKPAFVGSEKLGKRDPMLDS